MTSFAIKQQPKTSVQLHTSKSHEIYSYVILFTPAWRFLLKDYNAGKKMTIWVTAEYKELAKVCFSQLNVPESVPEALVDVFYLTESEFWKCNRKDKIAINSGVIYYVWYKADGQTELGGSKDGRHGGTFQKVVTGSRKWQLGLSILYDDQQIQWPK